MLDWTIKAIYYLPLDGRLHTLHFNIINPDFSGLYNLAYLQRTVISVYYLGNGVFN